MKNNKKIDYKEFDIDFLNACSTTDCTGLIPTAPQNQEEIEAYNNIYTFEPNTECAYKKDKK